MVAGFRLARMRVQSDSPTLSRGQFSRTHKAKTLNSILRTFLVEDSPVIRENLAATLEEIVPLRVVGTARDEAGAIRWLSEPDNLFELGIIDIFLERGTGLGVLKAIRGANRAVKLVVLSNFATPEMRRTCLALGADEVFDKSNDIDALLRYCAQLADAGIGDGAKSGASF